MILYRKNVKDTEGVQLVSSKYQYNIEFYNGPRRHGNQLPFIGFMRHEMLFLSSLQNQLILRRKKYIHSLKVSGGLILFERISIFSISQPQYCSVKKFKKNTSIMKENGFLKKNFSNNNYTTLSKGNFSVVRCK